jgi:hypothetical protein
MNTRTTTARKARRRFRKLARALHRLGDHAMGTQWHHIARRIGARDCRPT